MAWLLLEEGWGGELISNRVKGEDQLPKLSLICTGTQWHVCKHICIQDVFAHINTGLLFSERKRQRNKVGRRDWEAWREGQLQLRCNA